jgi:hypothetical protein
MGLKPGTSGSYSFTIDPQDIASFDPSVSIYLEDKQNPGNWVNLRNQNTYSFTANTTDEANRFNLHFSPQNNTGSLTNSNTDINIFASGSNVMVDFSKLKTVNATIQIYDILGQQLSSEEHMTTDMYSKYVNTTEAAYVIVMVRMDNGQVQSRKLFLMKN